ncbi:MAG: ABC transporter substrate-binding protein [Epsilonproteobacteria bacterium]|nr:ABC transporter substrate-binding protein [Campylobacterota bacterium]
MFYKELGFKILFFVLFFCLSVFYIASNFVQPAPIKELSIATGSATQNYYQTALKYKELLAKQNVKLNIVQTSGSIENLALLHNSKVDIAFIQSGVIDAKQHKNIQSLASVYYEPLWIFYKNNGYLMEYIVELINKRVGIGVDGSGTQFLAKKILNDNGITSKNTTLISLSSAEAKKKLLSGEIDAMFMVTSPNSSSVVELLSNPNIELLGLKRTKAYEQKYKFLSPLVLYEGTIDLYKNLPSEDKNLLATTANLVCRKGLNDELIRIFLKQLKPVHAKESIFEKENEFPSLENLDTTIAKEASNYLTKGDSWLESIFPFWVASQIDRLKILLIPLLTLLFPLLKGILPLYNWSIRSKIYKWYKRLDKLEYSGSLSQEKIEAYLEELAKLKNEVQEHTKVPLSYKGEYYNLLLHIDSVANELLLKKD